MRFNRIVVWSVIGCMLVPIVSVADEVTTETPLYNTTSQVEQSLEYFDLQESSTVLAELNNGEVSKTVQIPENIVVPDVTDYLSVRKKASESSACLVKMKTNTFATVIDDETYENWIKVRVGEVEGYVFRDYVLTGKKARKYVKKHLEEYKTGISLLRGVFAIGVYDTIEDAESDTFDYTTSALVSEDSTMYVEKQTGEERKEEVDHAEKGIVVCDSDGEYLYQEQDENSTRVGMIFNNAETDVVEKGEVWSKITNEAGITGYTLTENLNFETVEVPISNIVTEVKEGTEVKIIEEGETWVKVKYKETVTEDGKEKKKKREGYMLRSALEVTYTPTEESKATDTLAYGETFEIEETEDTENTDYVKTDKGYIKKICLTDSVIEDEDNIEYVSASARKGSTVKYNLGGIPKGKAKEVVKYALKFVGNPYVWGGNSLTNGVDCSGFTQQVYKHFGYSLPRVAADQANAYRRVKLKDVKPGDLIFYEGSDGVIGHVSMYIGNNQVVHASNRKDGIKISDFNYRTPCCAIRILDDEDLKDVKSDVKTNAEDKETKNTKTTKDTKDKKKETTEVETKIEETTESTLDEDLLREIEGTTEETTAEKE
jgi:cell wall-associated NlpC family hydrolase